MIGQLTAIIERENSEYVALCPELDIASQGASIEQARGNLIKVLELLSETAPPVVGQRRYCMEQRIANPRAAASGKQANRR